MTEGVTGTLGTGVTIPRGAHGVATVQVKKTSTQSGISTSEATGTLCTFDTAQINIGGHWSDANNRFTVPETGIYRIGWGGAGFNSNDTVFRMHLWLNGVKSNDGQVRIDQLANQYLWGSRTTLWSLTESDYVEVHLAIDSSTTTWYADANLQTYFNIEFIG